MRRTASGWSATAREPRATDTTSAIARSPPVRISGAVADAALETVTTGRIVAGWSAAGERGRAA